MILPSKFNQNPTTSHCLQSTIPLQGTILHLDNSLLEQWPQLPSFHVLSTGKSCKVKCYYSTQMPQHFPFSLTVKSQSSYSSLKIFNIKKKKNPNRSTRTKLLGTTMILKVGIMNLCASLHSRDPQKY